MASVNEELRDRAIRHALYVIRYSAGISDRYVRLLNAADADILDKIAASVAQIDERGVVLSSYSQERLARLLEEVRAINGAIYERLHTALSSELQDFGTGEAEFQRKSLVTSVGADLGTSVPAPAMMRAIVEETPMTGVLLKPWIDNLDQVRIDRIEQAIRLGMVQGEGTDAIVRRIRGTRALNYQDGILDKSRSSVQALVRTSVNHVQNVAAQHTWEANEHLIKGWQFVATLDSRTSPTCAGLDGQVFPVGEGPIPPRHPRCRSITVAVTKSFKELGVYARELPPSKRASMDGQVAGDIKFDKWLRDKGEATQNDILGKTRAALFRAGKLDLRDFIKSDGTVLTLAQLHARYPTLFT